MWIKEKFCVIFLLINSASIKGNEPILGDLPEDVRNEILKILVGDFPTLTCRSEAIDRHTIDLYFYSRNTTNPIRLNDNNLYNIDSSKKLLIITHGYLWNYKKTELQQLKNVYLQKYDYNIIMVDWSEYSSGTYSSAVCSVYKISRTLGNFLCNLNNQGFINFRNTHIIGHSLGAQIAGITGKHVGFQCSQQLGRITGLDPAGPLFNGKPTLYRLDKNDAMFVDVIHTNGGVFGYVGPAGHVDFYPNCGLSQSCASFDLEFFAILKYTLSERKTNYLITSWYVVFLVICSHVESVSIMTEAVRNDKLEGIRCYGCFPVISQVACPSKFKASKYSVIMGEKTPSTARGLYYVPWNITYP